MRPSLLALPFVAILIAAVSLAIGSTLPNGKLISALGVASAAALSCLWIVLDFDNFKRLFQRKGAKYGASSGLIVLVALVAIVGTAVLSSRPRFNKSWDVTRQKSNTLSDQSIKAVASINASSSPIKVRAYFIDRSVKDQFTSLLSLYLEQGIKLQTEYIDPQTDPLRAKEDKLTSGNTVIVSSELSEARITTFTEEKVTNAFLNVLRGKSKKIYFVKGHGEGQVKGSEESGFSLIAQELEANKFEVEELSLLQDAKIPEDADLLVIAGPVYDFKEEEARLLEGYLAKGGSALVLAKATNDTPNLAATLAKFGLVINNDILVLHPDDQRAAILGSNNAIISDFDDFHPVSRDFAKQSQVAMITPDTRSIGEIGENQYEMKVTTIAKTVSDMVRVKDVRSNKDLDGGSIAKERLEAGAFPVIAVAAGKAKNPEVAKAPSSTSPSTTGSDAAATDSAGVSTSKSEKEIRVILSGSAEFASNRGMQAPEHRDMFLNMVNFLLQDEDFIAIRPKDLTKTTMNLAAAGSQPALWILSIVYPFAFLIGGIGFWLTRRRA